MAQIQHVKLHARHALQPPALSLQRRTTSASGSSFFRPYSLQQSLPASAAGVTTLERQWWLSEPLLLLLALATVSERPLRFGVSGVLPFATGCNSRNREITSQGSCMADPRGDGGHTIPQGLHPCAFANWEPIAARSRLSQLLYQGIRAPVNLCHPATIA